MWSRSPAWQAAASRKPPGMNQYGIVLVGQLRAQGGQAAHGGLNIPGEGATGKQGGFPGQSRAQKAAGGPRTWRDGCHSTSKGQGCKIRSMGRPPGYPAAIHLGSSSRGMSWRMQSPIDWGTTKVRRLPRRFLSPRARRSRVSGSNPVSVGSRYWRSRARIWSLVSPLQKPKRAAAQAIMASPTATQAPWAREKPLPASTPWPRVCPRFRSCRGRCPIHRLAPGSPWLPHSGQ